MGILIDTKSLNGAVDIKLMNLFSSQDPEKRKWCFIKLLNIEQELFITNDKLKELYGIHNILSNRDASDYNPMFYSRKIFKYFKLCKEIVHDLRCTIEMMLLLTSLVSDSDKKIDTIEKYLKLVNDGKTWVYDTHVDFFKLIKLMDNSSKHHFTNDLEKRISNDEPLIVMIRCTNNFNFSNAKMIEEPVEKIISDFNLFYNHAFHEIKEFSKKAKRS